VDFTEMCERELFINKVENVSKAAQIVHMKCCDCHSPRSKSISVNSFGDTHNEVHDVY